MARISLFIGIGLTLVGLIGYALATVPSPTALIPALFGAVIILGGLLSFSHEAWRKHLMHLNAVLSLILLVVAAIRLPLAAAKVSSDALPFTALMDTTILSALLVFCAVRSFVEARLARNNTPTSPKSAAPTPREYSLR